MADNLFEARYDVTKRTKLRKFYESNKILIFSFISILVILFVAFSLYMEAKEKKKILLSENYLQAKIYLEDGKKKSSDRFIKRGSLC